VNCAICGIRKPRRHCPGLRGDICTVCCGTEREQSVDCPIDCVYLQEAHRHEKLPEIDAAALPNADIKVTEDFLRANEVLLAFLSTAVYEGALAAPGATDYDVREGLEALVRTYRTRSAGLYYESMPVNTFAAAVVTSVQERLDDIKKRETEATGRTSIRDSTVLGLLAFLQRLEYGHNNGRRRSRAFIDFLSGFYIPVDKQAPEESLEPDEPRIIL
jgi:hypothetical protein